MVKFGYSILYVKDVIQSTEFYCNAFGFKVKFIAPGNDYGELISGETTLAFCVLSLAKTNLSNGFIESSLSSKPFGIELGFIADDVHQVFNHALTCGAIEAEKPKEKPWGQTVAYVRDGDGFLIEICSSMD